jgi:HEAT repeat protein
LVFPICAVFAQDPGWHKVPKDTLVASSADIIKKIIISTDEAELLKIVEPETNDEESLRVKMFAYKRLALYGTKNAVPTLVGKLDIDKEGFYSRYALESITGKEIDVALCQAAKKTTKPIVLAEILTTLGVRANTVSKTTAKSFLTHKDPNVKRAAAYAFASTASVADIGFFTKKNIDPIFADAAFLLAERLKNNGNTTNAIRIYDSLATANILPYQKEAALIMRILARGEKGINLLVAQLNSESEENFNVGLKAGRELTAGSAVTTAMIKQLDKQNNPTRKSKLVRAIGDRKDTASKKVSLPVFLELAKAGDEVVRVAAIESFNNIGDSSVLPVLVEAAKQNESPTIAKAARLTLQQLSGKDIDSAISDLFVNGDKATRIIAIDLIKERRIISAYPLLNKSFNDPDADISRAVMDAIGQTAGLDDLLMILDLFVKTQTQAETDKILGVLKSACTRLPQNAASAEVFKAFEKAQVPAKVKLLEVFNVIGGAKAVEIVERSAWEDVADVQNKATEILGKWVSQKDVDLVAAACLKLAKESKYKGRGLRGYIRLARQFNMSEDRKLQICQETYNLATRDEDRILIFDVYTRNPSPKVFEVAAKYLESESEMLRDKAEETVVAIGEKLQVKSQKTADVMKKVIDQSKNENLKVRAKLVFDKQ